jgi:hypothetical protein
MPSGGVAAVTMTYTAICKRADDWWEITVPELESGQVTQAARLEDVEDTVKDLVALMTDVEPEDVVVDVHALGRHDYRGLAIGIVAVGSVIEVLRRVMSRAASRLPH